MPSRLNSPVITVDMANISKVDPSNVDNLFSMWTIFSKCAESLENGRRLENLSWRLWNRETFCCDDNLTGAKMRTTKKTATTATKKSPASSSSSSPVPAAPKRQNSETYTEVPELSSSVESAVSDDELPKERSGTVAIGASRPCVIRSNSGERYRGKEKHMTPEELAKLMEDIDRSKSSIEEWMSQREQIQAMSQSEQVTKMSHSEELQTKTEREVSAANRSASMPMRTKKDAYKQKTASSPEPISSVRSTASITRGFHPGQVVSYRSSSHIAMAPATSPMKPAPTTKPRTTSPTAKPKPIFFIGSGSSDSDDEDSFEESYRSYQESKSALRSTEAKKKATFHEQIASETVYEDVSDSDSAIDDDDDDISDDADDADDWESESCPSDTDQHQLAFPRVDSKPALTSRRSLLSSMLHEPDRAAAIAAAAARASPAVRHRRDHEPSGIARARPALNPAGLPDPLHPAAMSPRTTIKNMITTEWPESLRKNLLWERQHRNTAAANLRRRHTAHDMTKLTEYPEPQGDRRREQKDPASRGNSWNYFEEGGLEYHATGW